jgi:hypothetical protein
MDIEGEADSYLFVTEPLDETGISEPEENKTPTLRITLPRAHQEDTPLVVEIPYLASEMMVSGDEAGAQQAAPLQVPASEEDVQEKTGEPSFEDLTLAEAFGQLWRAPIPTLRAIIQVARTPEAAPKKTPILRPAYAVAGVVREADVALPGLIREQPSAPSRPDVPEVPQIEDHLSKRRELQQLGLRVIAFLLAWWATLTMVSSPSRSEAEGLDAGMPMLVIGFVVWLAAEALGGRGQKVEPLAKETKDTPVSMAELAPRLVMITFAIALGGAAVWLTTNNLFTVGGALAWMGSIILGAWAVTPLDWSPLKALEDLGRIRIRVNWVFIALVVITLVGGYFRLKDLNLLPPEMTSDHVEMLLDGQRVLSGNTQVFFAGNGGREAAQFYGLALISQLPGFGLDFFTLKLLNVIEGILTIPVMYWMGRAVIGERERKLGTVVGLLLAAFVAVSYWHTILSRLGERIVLMPLMTALLIIFLARALRYNRRGDFIWAGIALGFGMYTYQAFRLMPLVIGVAGFIALLFYLRRGRELRHLVLNFVALGFVAFLIYLPLFSYSLQYPEDYWRRTSGRLFGDEITQTTDDEGNLIFRQPTLQERLDAFNQNFPTLLMNIRNALLMYNWKGDVAWVQNYPNEPAFDPITAGLFVVGIAAWIGRMFRRRDPFTWVFPFMFLIMLLPSAFAIAAPIENPSFTRMSGTLPLAYVLVALPLALMARSAARLIGGVAGALVAGVVVVGLILGSYITNQNTYFAKYHQSYLDGSLPHGEAGSYLRGFGESVGFGNAFIINSDGFFDHRAVGIGAGRLDFPNGIASLSDVPEYLRFALQQVVPYTLDPEKDLLFIYSAFDLATHEWLQSKFPNGFSQLIESYQPENSFYLFRVPPLGAAAFEAFLEDAADDDLSQQVG